MNSKSLWCLAGLHNWTYTGAVYTNDQAERLAIPQTPAKRVCDRCGKKQHEDRHCLGLNPPEYYSTWYTDHQCAQQPTSRDILLHGLAKEYHDTCERYDRSVCTGRIYRGSIMPATKHQLGLINKHAASVLAQVIAKAVDNGISRKDMMRAIQHYNGVYDGQEQES